MNMTLETIRAAHARIAPYIVRTPLLRLPALDDALGCEVYVKAECMQRTGAFKLRGAMNKILTLTDAERARGFVAASSSNHGRVRLSGRPEAALEHDALRGRRAGRAGVFRRAR